MAKTGTAVAAAQLVRSNVGIKESTTSVAASAASYNIPASGKNLLLGFIPTAAGNFTIKAGTGIAATKDLTWAITASKINWIQLDTSSYAKVKGSDGDDKGDIVITADGTVAGTLFAVSAL
jgi:hypothetical protein